MQTLKYAFAIVTTAILALIVCILNSGCKQSDVHDVKPADTLVYIMAGQSNMAGRGIVEPQDTISDPRILSLEGDNSIAIKSEPNTLNQGWLAGLDCGKTFGAQLLAKLPESTYICLVQCSISSTPITEWLGDSLHVVKLYSYMLERTRLAMRRGKLKGVLWQHGEGDADELATAELYSERLQQLIQKFRADIGDPALPFYIGKLPEWCNKPLAKRINEEIEDAARSMSNVFVISTDGLSGRSDSLHFDAEGQRGLGRRYAEAAGKLL